MQKNIRSTKRRIAKSTTQSLPSGETLLQISVKVRMLFQKHVTFNIPHCR